MRRTRGLRVLLVSGNRERRPQPVVPIGLAYVAASLRRRHDVAALDLCWEAAPVDALVAAIADVRPDVVGLAMRNLDTPTYDGQDDIANAYREYARAIRGSTGAPLVVGGAGFSLQPVAMAGLLRPDHGLVAESEETMAWLVDRMARGESAPAIVRAGVDGAPAAPALDDLAPPARDLFDRRHYAAGGGTTSIQTKRGCAFGCAYCDYPDLEGRHVRLRDPESVASEFVAAADDADVRAVFIVDSVFTSPPAHAIAVCEALIRRGSRTPWVCYAAPRGLSDPVLTAMAAAGCVGVEIGSDSGTAAGLRRLRKPFGLAEIESAHERCAAHGLRDCHSFVLGAYGETLAEVQETLEFVDRLDPDVAVFTVFQEQRESIGAATPATRPEILALLGAAAPAHGGWSVPELGIHVGWPDMWQSRGRLPAGPPWLMLAGLRRSGGWLSSVAPAVRPGPPPPQAGEPRTGERAGEGAGEGEGAGAA